MTADKDDLMACWEVFSYFCQVWDTVKADLFIDGTLHSCALFTPKGCLAHGFKLWSQFVVWGRVDALVVQKT